MENEPRGRTCEVDAKTQLTTVGFDTETQEDPDATGFATNTKERDNPAFGFDFLVMRAERYELGIDREIQSATRWWPLLIADAKKGLLELELFEDMATFAFDDFAKEALENRISRFNAYQALAIKEFADVRVDGDEFLTAAQLVAESLCTQTCAGWQLIDGKVSPNELVVYMPSGEKTIIGMHPMDLTPLLEAIAKLGASSTSND